MTQQTRSPRNKRPPEPSSSKDSETSKINKIYKTSKTLSENEREIFLNFGLKKAQELPNPPTLPKKWVETHFEELYAEFKKSVSTAAIDWSQHPQRDKWIEQIRQGRPGFIAQGGPLEERETRRQFAEWAEANNLVWGVQA